MKERAGSSLASKNYGMQRNFASLPRPARERPGQSWLGEVLSRGAIGSFSWHLKFEFDPCNWLGPSSAPRFFAGFCLNRSSEDSLERKQLCVEAGWNCCATARAMSELCGRDINSVCDGQCPLSHSPGLGTAVHGSRQEKLFLCTCSSMFLDVSSQSSNCRSISSSSIPQRYFPTSGGRGSEPKFQLPSS